MFNCVFTPYCTNETCDLACPRHAEILYWMKRCNLDINNPVLNSSSTKIQYVTELIKNNLNTICVFKADKPIDSANLFSYVAICNYGLGTGLNGGVYHLNFQNYIDELKRSWQTKFDSEDLMNIRIWNQSANYLIISNLEYVKFGDFESQTLLSLLQSRDKPSKSTFIILNKKEPLIGSDSVFFSRLRNKLAEVTVS